MGGYTEVATTIATAAYTTYRINYGNCDKRIHISRNTASCWSSSSAYGTSVGSTQQGHVRPADPGQSSAHNVPPNACGFGGTGYNINSKEWNSKGYKEGFAHLISSRTWNDWDELGTAASRRRTTTRRHAPRRTRSD